MLQENAQYIIQTGISYNIYSVPLKAIKIMQYITRQRFFTEEETHLKKFNPC